MTSGMAGKWQLPSKLNPLAMMALPLILQMTVSQQTALFCWYSHFCYNWLAIKLSSETTLLANGLP